MRDTPQEFRRIATVLRIFIIAVVGSVTLIVVPHLSEFPGEGVRRVLITLVPSLMAALWLGVFDGIGRSLFSAPGSLQHKIAFWLDVGTGIVLLAAVAYSFTL